MKRFLSFVCIMMFLLSTITHNMTVQAQNSEYKGTQITNFCSFNAAYGENLGTAYDEENKLFYIKTKVSENEIENESDSSMLIDMNFASKGNQVDLNTYRYMKISYYRMGGESPMRIKGFLTDGNTYQCMKYGVSDKWHDIVVDFGSVESGVLLKQIHFSPYPDVSSRALIESYGSAPYVYIHSIGFYTSDPRTSDQIAEDEILSAPAQAMRGANQETGIFKHIENLEKTGELLSNTSIESLTGWLSTYSTVSLADGGYDGDNCVKITNRTQWYSGVKQDITSVLREYGAGYYKISAFLKTDGQSASIGNLFDVRINLTKNETDEDGNTKKVISYLYSSYPISDTWQKNENIVYIPWDDTCLSASFAVYGGSSSEKILSDYYVDNCSMVKYIEDKTECTHSAYISAREDGNFYPDSYITGKEFYDVMSKCSQVSPEYSLRGETKISGDLFVSNISSLLGYIPDESFNGKYAVTRAEVVQVVNKALKRKASVSSYTYAPYTGFKDVPLNHPAYSDIIEASADHDAVVYSYKDSSFDEVWYISEYDYNKSKSAERISQIDIQTQLRKSRILNSSDTPEISGTKYYVSNNGSDSNTGLTPETPLKTISAVSYLDLKPGDAVLFERGSVWRGVSFSAVSGVTYSAYGSGDKPMLIGSDKDYASTLLWKATDTENVWVTTDKISGSAGFVSFNNFENVALKKNSLSELTTDYTFFDGTTTDSKIYLYCSKGNPGQVYSNIEIAPGRSLIRIMNQSDCVIDNLCLKYTGWHGVRISKSDNITVSNCEIAYIGGTGEGSRWGNAIEFWNSCNGGLVKDNYVYQVYDTAFTNQYKGVTAQPCLQQNITYTGNIAEYCSYSFEFFVRQENSNLDMMKNITVSDNISRFCGFGWGEDNRPVKETATDIKGWRSKNRTENFVIKNNIFTNTRYRFVDWSSFAYNIDLKKLILNNTTPQYLPVLTNNVYVCKPGDGFGEFDYTSYVFDYDVNRLFEQKRINIEAEIVFDIPVSLPDTEEYVVSKPHITLENNKVFPGNKIVSNVYVGDNNSDTDKKLQFVVCLYDGIRLVHMSVVDFVHNAYEEGLTLNNSSYIPDGRYENCEIRAFVFDEKFNSLSETAYIKLKQ